MKHALLLCVCLLVVCVAAQRTPQQENALSAKATKLSTALAELRTAQEDRQVRMQYLEAFPKTYKEYLLLFDLGQPLYDGHDYVEVISSLAKTHELEVGILLVDLSKDAHYDADAPAYLQHETCIYANEHTSEFLNLLKRLPLDKQANLIKFLADVENHAAYPEYQVIIDHSKALGETAIAKRFELARAKRERQPHD